ncbi:hypothetical protein D3C86_1664820 [compost metagenome]
MLQYFWPGYGAVLGNVANQKYGGVRFLCKAQQFSGAFPYLRYTARRRFNMCRVQCLYGIHNDDFWPQCFYLFKDVLRGCFRQDVTVGLRPVGNALCPHLDLLLAFLPGNI